MLGKFAKKLKRLLGKLSSNNDLNEQSNTVLRSGPAASASRLSDYDQYKHFLDEEDAYYRNMWDRSATTDKTIYTKEFFVYGSLQPGNMNFDRLKEETIKAERVEVPGYIRILHSGFGGLHPHPALPQGGTAMTWGLPETTPQEFEPSEQTEYAKGWILTLQGTIKFFNMLDAFEGFYPYGKYAGAGSYERRALWINGRWMWSYPMPKDNPNLEKIYEWTDDTITQGWRSRGYSSYSSNRGSTGSTGTTASNSGYSYASSWACSDDDYSDEEAIYAGCYKKPLALPAPKESENGRLDEWDSESTPEWVFEARRELEGKFTGRASGFEDPKEWSKEEEELLKGDAWKGFVEEHLAAPF